MTELVVIGAGVAGLVCAALARAQGASVTVIEAGASAGGLWKSTAVELGGRSHHLDAGLRLPVLSGTKSIDDAIFHRPDFRFSWVYYDGWPRESAITADRFNAESSCLDTTVLGAKLSVALDEIRATRPVEGAENAEDYSLNWFGPTLTNSLVRDAVLGLFETDLSELAPNAVKWFLPRRMIAGDHQATARLLDDDALAGRIAHARYCDLPKNAARQFLRPQSGGISTWINALQQSLAADGVTFLFNDAVQDIDRAPVTQRVERIVLRSGAVIRPAGVISTIAPALVARAMGVSPGALPRFRHLQISHVLVDRPVSHQAEYALNFNRHPAFFRAIFHDNIGDTEAGSHIITFEHLVDELLPADLARAALDECRRCGIIDPNATVLGSHSDLYRNIIPVPTVDYGKATAQLKGDTLDRVPNLRFVGRSAGTPFLDGIIQEAALAIKTTIGAENYA
ncbi:NAD(P)-binding protein [Ensifer sp.]|uniref:NAD(P)-binding protein n=1 Tax=Ensifer sp. TaxID=1872086 RepID=UPI0028A1AEA8|nr:NAD(P)-binding protein [Ensifer sp.]